MSENLDKSTKKNFLKKVLITTALSLSQCAIIICIQFLFKKEKYDF